ncbi:hypothetical protein BKA65DRAFT_519538 [Rhexocercosporidium sp. MPI-PUGE-AT-0058]|nr:hypothetical protein BKA65DRAFT_519538 [Rhexocercosporidium sp. MPI-PUGE-AT-0058]
MATDTPHKQEFRIRDLSTRSVLLFPSRAQVIRDIKNITLHPGANQIVIDGLSPLVDEHSIKVEGTGSATITDVTVDLLPNREVYEDVYPSDSEDEDESESEDSDAEVEQMKIINERIKNLHVRLLNEQEKINSAADRLRICDNFGKSVEKERPAPNDLEELISAYQTERKKIYQDHEAATGTVEEVREDIRKTEKQKMKLAKALVKANEKAEKEKAKEREKKLRKKAEVAKEKQRIKAERESFWPKKVYCITINLEPSSLTPASSRRSSIDGDTVVNLATSEFHEASNTPLKNGEISLSLSYITHGASWAPRYDLSLNTVKCTGLLEYGAELKNTTSETWHDAKVILSTSQTTFSGLSETIPILLPWHVRLEKGARNADSSLFSQHELSAKQKEWNQTKGDQHQKPRWELFGRDDSSRDVWLAQQNQVEAKKKSERLYQAQNILKRTNNLTPQMFGSSAVPPPPAAASFGGMAGVSRHRQAADYEPADSRRSHSRFLDMEAEVDDLGSDNEAMGFGTFDNGPAAPKSLTFEEGAWEETGMTTTYDVPGTKTLHPNNSTIKHKIAKIEFKNIVFSHIVVGKLRQVAFLKARLRNASKITLLKGPLGLTLDGSFLGQATFPRCSAGESFSLPLGVDPAINIAYPKPTVRRSQTGIFTKEDSNVFTRTIIITNTKHNAPIEITVIDQVPVSEDERLKIEIANPRGLKVGGEGVRTGQSAFATSTTATSAGNVKGTAKDVRASVYGADGKDVGQGGKWGSAIATTKKGGEVIWNVKLNPGQGVRLALEYEATFPGGERVVGVPVTRNQNGLFD